MSESGQIIPAALRIRVRQRARGRCEYCRIPSRACYAPFHCDHHISRAHGGPTSYENLVWACPWCNGSKRERSEFQDPETGLRVPLFNPRRDRWHDHFRWSSDARVIYGRTSVGRATVNCLKMNRRDAKIIRGYLLQLNLHPIQAR